MSLLENRSVGQQFLAELDVKPLVIDEGHLKSGMAVKRIQFVNGKIVETWIPLETLFVIDDSVQPVKV